MSRFRWRFCGAILTSLLAAGCVLGFGTADGAVNARALTQPARITLSPTAGPAVHPVRAPSIRSLPRAVPGHGRPQAVDDHEIPGSRDPHAGNSRARVTDIAPPAARATRALAAGTSFAFTGMGESVFTPSDSNSAPGPVNVIEQINSEVSVYNRNGALEQGPATEDGWYEKGGDTLVDAHTLFVPSIQRFVTMAMDEQANSWVLSVTSTNDALSSRCDYTIGALDSGATGVDFPLIGASSQFLTLTIRELSSSGNGNRLELVDLSQLAACATASTFSWENVVNPGAGVADTLTPVLDYTTSDSTTYLVDSFGGGGSHVSLWTINDSGTPVLSGVSVAVPAYTPAPSAPQEGSSVDIDTGNSVIAQAVKYGTAEYAALTTDANGAAGILVLKFHPDAGTLDTSALLATSGFSYFYPSITVEADGDAVVSYDLSGPGIDPSAAVFGLTAHTITPVTFNQFTAQGTAPATQQAAANCTSQPCTRWGDFTSIYTDPTSSINDFWSTGMYQPNSSAWGTVIAHGTA